MPNTFIRTVSNLGCVQLVNTDYKLAYDSYNCYIKLLEMRGLLELRGLFEGGSYMRKNGWYSTNKCIWLCIHEFG